MSAGIKLTKTAQNTRIANPNAAAVEYGDVCINTITNTTTDIQLNCSVLCNENISSSISHLPSLQEQSSAADDCGDLLQQTTKVPLENSPYKEHATEEEQEQVLENNKTSIVASQNGDQQINHEDESVQLSPGLSLLQHAAATASPPPHSYRHSRAYRHFKNPPQPHMCIHTTTESGEKLFINVLSWTRIVIPQEPSDPIPLYGGMRVPPGSPRSPPIVFAVMANPEVLKDSGRHSKDPEERRAMVELMCDFVEAMNPGVKLVRNAVILKDRDISGELKDVWNAVQAQRDREREEQLLQQRQQHQQQHYHNLTNGALNTNAPQQMFPKSMLGGEMLIGGEEGTPPRSRKMMQQEQSNDGSNNTSNTDEKELMINTTISLAQLAEQLDNKMSIQQAEGDQRGDERLTNEATLIRNGNNCKDSLDGNKQQEVSNQLNVSTPAKDHHNSKQTLTNGAMVNVNCNGTAAAAAANVGAVIDVKSTNASSNTPTSTAVTTPPSSSPAPAPTPPTKKEKLGGFLPNGCIFPRFTKNSKHKDKDKEGKTKDKEKNVLLSALKKSKDKKSNAAVAAAIATANQDDKQQHQEQNINNVTTSSSTANNKKQKNCLQQLECGVQKLDLNHIDNNTTTTTTTTSNNTNNIPANNTNNSSSSNNSSGVGVH